MKNLQMFLAALILIFCADFVQAQSAGSMDVNKGRSRGDDPEIKIEQRKNAENVDSKAVQPGTKGARTRGSLCYVTFDNYTPWYIDCYVDGYYEGYIAPWGDGSVSVVAGETRAYAVAEFDNGSRYSWGPITESCSDEFELTLYDGYVNYSVR